ncbi:hypothetical protein EV651_11232 [Kribbella sp. VKM Ac-2571]|nr:hypothetical protein EV651_11232 [Kribbella sp. VKM Ac-2571]
MIERLGSFSTERGEQGERDEVIPASHSYRGQRADAQLRTARTCYRHLATNSGVALADCMRRAGHISESWELTAAGRDFLSGLDALPHRTGQRPVPAVPGLARASIPPRR